MIKSQIGRRQPAGFKLVTDIAGAEDAGGRADQCIERDEAGVEVVDDQVMAGRRMRAEKQGQRGEQRQKGRRDIEARGGPIARQKREHGSGAERNKQDRLRGAERSADHRRSPRNWSSACTSTVSKRSRMRKRKMPMTMKAIRMEKATLISTTSGMPLAPVAASTNPFSSDMKPTTWPTALRRVTMIRRRGATPWAKWWRAS